MARMTIRNISDPLHRALKARAAANGRSAEAEVRWILGEAVKQPDGLRMGEALHALGRELAISDADVDAIEAQRSTQAAEPPRFE